MSREPNVPSDFVVEHVPNTPPMGGFEPPSTAPLAPVGPGPEDSEPPTVPPVTPPEPPTNPPTEPPSAPPASPPPMEPPD